MIKQGIIRPSHSSWSNPIHMVPKADGRYRICGDFRKLNSITKTDSYPLPLLHDFTSNLSACTIFSRIDLAQAFYQIPMDINDIPKTAICTPIGLFEFLKMPLGLKNSPSTFQRFIDSLFRGDNFVFVYLDDILIASIDEEQH